MEKEKTERCTLTGKVEEVVAILSDKRDEWKDCITGDVVLEQIHNKLTEEELEREDQDKRRNSVIVFGLKESSSPQADVRVADDVEKMQEVIQELDIHQEADICKVIRLGRRAETADEKPRPLKVTLNSENVKLEITKNAKKLEKQE